MSRHATRACDLPRASVLACALVPLLALAGPAAAAAPTRPSLSGDLRVNFAMSQRDDRDGLQSSSDDVLARIRVRAAGEIGIGWRYGARLAGSYAGDQDRFDFYLRRYRPSPTGVLPGDTTADELFLGYTDPESRWSIRVGRFNTAFKLPVVADKSLDRNDASNVGIGWTDGVHLELPLGQAWRAHLIAQTNSRRGTGNTFRGPLNFGDGDSRVSAFAALEATRHPGPFIMRMLSLSWMPATLAPEGIAADRREDYLTVTAKTAAAWPIGASGLRLVAAGEIGHAFKRPERQAIGLSGNQAVSGNAWQASLNLMDLRPGHHLGAVYGRAQGGWLISNDYRQNDELAEVRYQWRQSRALMLELRYRWRRELELPLSADRPRRDRDSFVRVSYRF